MSFSRKISRVGTDYQLRRINFEIFFSIEHIYWNSVTKVANMNHNVEDSDENDNKFFSNLSAEVAQDQVAGFPEYKTSTDKTIPHIQSGNRTKRRTVWLVVSKPFKRLYFSQYCVNDEHEFERRFQIPRRLFQQVDATLRRMGISLPKRENIGCPGIHSHMCIIAAL